MSVRDGIAAAFLLAGSCITFIAAVGLHRMTDMYARMHVATKPATLGLALTLTGAAVRLGTVPAVATLALALVFQLATAPVGSHLIGRAARRVGVPLSSYTVVDDAADDGVGPLH